MTVTETHWSCDACSTEQEIGEVPVETTAGFVCQDCETDFVHCEACGRLDHVDESVYADSSDSWYCRRHSSSVSICDSCQGTVDLYRNGNFGDANVMLCRRCRDNWYISCEFCHDVIHQDEINWSDRLQQHYCDPCEYELPSSYNRIESYSYKPNWTVWGRHYPDQRKETTFGVELEVEYGDNTGEEEACDLLRQMWSDEDVTFLKSDGSLNDGVEAVSHPMTLHFARLHLNREALASLSRCGVRSWNTRTCGLHFHIGRDTFHNHSHLARFLILFTRSKDQVVALAGRDSSQWASFELSSNESLVKQAEGKQFPQTRYRAVNLSNDDTVEVRVFRGSLRPETIIAHMEFLHAMVEYTREQRRIVGLSTALLWPSFRSWLHSNRDKYPAAQQRCEERVDGRI